MIPRSILVVTWGLGVGKRLSVLLGIGLALARYSRDAQRQVESRAAGGRTFDSTSTRLDQRSTARPAQDRVSIKPAWGEFLIWMPPFFCVLTSRDSRPFFQRAGMIHALCEQGTCAVCPKSSAAIIKTSDIRIKSSPWVVTIPVAEIWRCMILPWLECADQSDDLRRQGQLPVCRDAARAFCGHPGSLGDLGSKWPKKKLEWLNAWRAQTPSTRRPKHSRSIYDCT